MPFRSTFRPTVESLDQRALPSATLTNHVLDVGGTSTDDFIRVSFAAPNQLRVTIPSTGEDVTFDRGQVTKILVRGLGGNDLIVVGPNLKTPAEVRGWVGDDTILGGGADDKLLGGSGNDNLNGRGGNDQVLGEAGDDRVNGGLGDDSINGGSGRDLAEVSGGNDDISNCMDLDTELIALFTSGQGKAEYKFGPDNGGIEREFDVEVEALTPNGTAGVFVDGQSVGVIALDSLGAGQFKLATDFDANHDGVADFPAGFPEIGVGSIVTVQLNGNVVQQGTFSPAVP